MDRYGLIDALIEKIEENPNGFDSLRDLLGQGFDGWPEDELIDEAQRFNIDTSEYDEGE